MAHPRNVGWGEIGLDYHYDNSPRDVQREVFSRQLRHAVRLGKPVTVHTREADEDTERILKAEVPKDHKVQYLRRTRRIDYSLIAFLSLSHRTGENKKTPLRYMSIASQIPQILHSAYWITSRTCTSASLARPLSRSLHECQQAPRQMD
jgi:Tat protein secretion system quality control protein TatD with DNase activity